MYNLCVNVCSFTAAAGQDIIDDTQFLRNFVMQEYTTSTDESKVYDFFRVKIASLRAGYGTRGGKNDIDRFFRIVASESFELG